MTRAGKVPAAGTYMAAHSVTAAKGVASGCMAAATGVAAAASVTATTGMALRQCRSCACQDQSQRANRQKNALALDSHLFLLTKPPTGKLQNLFNKTLAV
jgi:hypothetical protein